MVDLDDAALVERCRAGDVAAFEPLVEKYRQRVWRLAYNVLRDREEAWDVAQEAFIKAYQALPSFRGQSAFYTWLYRIVMNVAADRGRSRGAQGRAFGTDHLGGRCNHHLRSNLDWLAQNANVRTAAAAAGS